MDKDKRPPFVSYVRVRHTGLSPYKRNMGMNVDNIKTTQKIELLNNKNVELPNKAKQTQIKKNLLQRKKGKENERQIPDPSKKVQSTAQMNLKPRSDSKPALVVTAFAKSDDNIEMSPLYKNDLTTLSSKEEKTPHALYLFKTDEPNSVDNSEISISVVTDSGYFIPHNFGTNDGRNYDLNEGEVILGTSFIHEPNNEYLNENTPCSAESEKKSCSSSDIAPGTEENEKVEHIEKNDQIDVQGFHRAQLNSEIERLTDKADMWERLQKEVNLPNSVLDEVASTVGQTRLLLRSKFKQFENLINTYSTGCLRPEDLVGFWEMMYLQVIQLDEKYSKLENLEKNNWLEETESRQQTRKKTKRGGRKKKNKFNHVQSRFREAKALQESKQSEEQEQSQNVKNDYLVIQTPNKAQQEEMFDGELKAECTKTPLINKNIRAAQLSQRRTSTGIIMRQSLLGKLL